MVHHFNKILLQKWWLWRLAKDVGNVFAIILTEEEQEKILW